MLKVFIGELILGIPVVEVIRPNLNFEKSERWSERYFDIKDIILEIVEDPINADYILLPYNFGLVRERKDIVDKYKDLSSRYKKNVLVFYPGDSSLDVDFDNAIIFRNSQYRYKLKKNEIIMPGYVEDLGISLDLSPKGKGEKAKIGFCGWADFRLRSEYLKYIIKSLPIRFVSLFYKKYLLKLKGLWWRRKILHRLKNSGKIEPNFIIRKSYSGSEKTIELDPIQAKKEYVNNILESDFTLCVKGDGNFSTRFFETLSLGRVPVLIDTDCVLPFEDEIDYSSCILRIDWTKADRVDEIVSDFYAKLSNEEFVNMQKNARKIFSEYLKMNSYFKRILDANKLKHII